MNGIALREHRPYRPWRLPVESSSASGIRITPWRVVHATMGGRLMPYTIELMFAVVETTKALNRMMGKNEYEGATK